MVSGGLLDKGDWSFMQDRQYLDNISIDHLSRSYNLVDLDLDKIEVTNKSLIGSLSWREEKWHP